MSQKLPVRNPRSGEVDYELDLPSAEDVAACAGRLRAAQPAWAEDRQRRLEVLAGWGEAVAAARDDLEAALVADTGRRSLSRLEVDLLLGAIEGWCARAPGLLAESEGSVPSMPHLSWKSQSVPFPLVGVISPWNFPLTLSTIDTVPALAAGCAVLVKPSEVTPRFSEPLRRTIEAAGVLQEVLAFVPGDGGIGRAVIDQVDAVCFTGSVATGRAVARHAAERFIPAFLELGGKDPAIVLAGADLDAAATAIVRGALANAGQACQSIERVYAERSICGELTDAIVERVGRLRPNHPRIDRGEIGPLIFARQAEIIRAHLDDAVARGAKIVAGGKIERLGGGLWCQPTVLTGVDHTMLLMREESFGPLIPLMSVSGVEQAIELANDSEYGLSAAVFAETVEQAESVARRLEVGAVSLNDASLTSLVHDAEKNSFRASGLGASRMGPSGLLRFLRRKALIASRGAPLPLEAFSEGRPGD